MSIDAIDDSETSGQLSVAGHPIHTRMLVVDIARADAEHWRADCSLLDVRKRGFVPTGGDLQTAGLIHLMRIDARIECESLKLVALEPSQPVVAYEPTEEIGGESCRDPAPLLRALVGERFDDGFAKKLSLRFGGALGCTHLLTLAQLLASTVSRAMARELALDETARQGRVVGERIFKRSLVLDGFDVGDGAEMQVVIQMSDLHTAPRSACRGLLDRLERQHEVQTLARIDGTSMTLSGLRAQERDRTRVDLSTAPWRNIDERVAGLVGLSALRGLGRELLNRLGADGGDRALLDNLLNLAPGLIQCLAAAAHRLVERHVETTAADAPAEESASATNDRGAALHMGGFPDSCYMWRSDGPLHQIRHRWGGEADGAEEA